MTSNNNHDRFTGKVKYQIAIGFLLIVSLVLAATVAALSYLLQNRDARLFPIFPEVQDASGQLFGEPEDFGSSGAVANLIPPLSNVEWFELASERTEIDVQEVREQINAGLEALEDMWQSSQELDAEGFADGLTALSRSNDNMKYALSFLRPESEISVMGGEEEEEGQEYSDYIQSLEAARPPDPLRGRTNVTTLDVGAINNEIDTVDGVTGYVLGMVAFPGGIVDDRMPGKIQEAANALFKIRDMLNFSVPIEEVTVRGMIDRIPQTRQEALQEDAGTSTIFTSFHNNNNNNQTLIATPSLSTPAIPTMPPTNQQH